MLTGNWSAAEDLVQTALARTWRRWDRIVRRDDPEAYIRRVLVTTYVSGWRRRWRGEVATDDLPDSGVERDVHDDAIVRAVVRDALAALPPRQRAVVVLRFFDDLTEARTAELLQCSIGTVKSQTAKAMAKLRTDGALASLLGEEVPR